MSHDRVVTPRASTRSRAAPSPKRAMPQTSFWVDRYSAMGNAICPAGPVRRIFSSWSMADLVPDPTDLERIVHAALLSVSAFLTPMYSDQRAGDRRRSRTTDGG